MANIYQSDLIQQFQIYYIKIKVIFILAGLLGQDITGPEPTLALVQFSLTLHRIVGY